MNAMKAVGFGYRLAKHGAILAVKVVAILAPPVMELLAHRAEDNEDDSTFYRDAGFASARPNDPYACDREKAEGGLYW